MTPLSTDASLPKRARREDGTADPALPGNPSASSRVRGRMSVRATPKTSGAHEPLTSSTSSAWLFSDQERMKIEKARGGTLSWAFLQTNEAALRHLDVSKKEALGMASNDGGSQALAKLLTNYAELAARRFTHKQIIGIASHNGGGLALDAVLATYERLTQLGYDNGHIAAIASNTGGVGALNKVLATHERLTALRYSNDQIAAIASHNGGSGALDKVLAKHKALADLDFTNRQISGIASHNGGAPALEKVLATHERLTRLGYDNGHIASIASNTGGAGALDRMLATHDRLTALRYSCDQIASIASHAGGARALDQVLASHEALIAAGFEPHQIVGIASRDGGSGALGHVLVNHEILIAAGLDHDKIVTIAKAGGAPALEEACSLRRDDVTAGVGDGLIGAVAFRPGGAKALDTAKALNEPLGSLGYTEEQIRTIARRGGRQALEKVLAMHEQLTALTFDHARITAIASNNGGAQALQVVLTTYQDLRTAKFTHEQIDAMASTAGGARALETVHTSCKDFAALRYTRRQIVGIATNIGGAQALHQILKLHELLTGFGLTIPQICSIAAHNGGAPALAAIAQHFPLLKAWYSIEEIVAAGATKRGAAAVVENMARRCRMKQEDTTDSGEVTAPVWVERPLDQARTAFVPELMHCDLTGGLPVWSLDESRAVVVHHAMEPVPANNDRFPLRDPADPASRVYPRYADDDGKCHPNVKLMGIDLASGYKSYFKSLCDDPRAALAKGQTHTKVKQALLRNAKREFERLIREEETEMRPCMPRRLTREQLPEHERMLEGRYGLFLNAEQEADPPVLANGRILGFYMGLFAESDEQIAAIEGQHPEFQSYAMDAIRRGGRLTLYSALGCANDLAFANTALRASASQPSYDFERLNAEFVPFEVRLTDKQGRLRRETVVAMVALSNAIGKEIRVDYGDAFLDQFRVAPGPSPDEGVRVKTEPQED